MEDRQDKFMKIAFCGGHLTPALAVIEKIRETSSDPILFFGVKNTLENEKTVSLEYQTVTKIPNIKFYAIRSGKLQRYLSMANFYAPINVLFGFFQALNELWKFTPEVIVAFGSYVAVPVVIAGWILRIPVVICEQTIEGGLATKLTTPFASVICLSWTESLKFFPKNKSILTGNPLRNSIVNPGLYKELAIFLKQNAKLPIIYVTGGNQGSHYINNLVSSNLPILLHKYIVIHQCGSSEVYQDYAKICEKIKSYPNELKNRYLLVKNFATDVVGSVLKEADVVITRGGANTISELLFFQKKAIIIPLPFSQNNEQLKNAQLYKKYGFGEILKQGEVGESEKLLKYLEDLLTRSGSAAEGRRNGEFEMASDKIVKEIYKFKKTKN